MAAEYETFELVWQERTVAVSFKTNWLQTGHCHIELRSADRLPVTETGYRSQFVSDPTLTHAADIAAYVNHWLDEAADNIVWRRYLEDSRQLNLF